MKKLSLFALGCCCSAAVFAQIVVSPVGPISSIGTFLTGSGVTISNVVFTGDTNAIGYFTAINTTLNMSGGFVMTTGSTNDVPGPNLDTGAGIDNAQPGDSDLTVLAGGNTYNAAVLEFDCVPTDDTLFFNFMFGSEEYPEWVGAGFNDVFAIYISGPNIPFQNMAWIPNTTIPVSVENVNANMNASYYVDHTGDPYVQYDGTTTNLLATIPVVPGSTYHLKIGIADAADGVVDGGVFLEVGSFRTISPTAGIHQPGEENQLRIFPCPARGGNVSLQLSPAVETQATVLVYSLSGQLVISQVEEVNPSGTISLDISALESGLYTIEIQYGEELYRSTLPVLQRD